MRLWHYKMLPYLNGKLLSNQFRECMIAIKSCSEHNYETANNILINRICDYPKEHFASYFEMVINEMYNRNFTCSEDSINNFYKQLGFERNTNIIDEYINPFPN